MSDDEPLTDDERLQLKALIRAAEEHTGITPTPMQIERVAKTLVSRRHKAWMRTFVERQGTHIPDFDALYRRKAELELRLDRP